MRFKKTLPPERLVWKPKPYKIPEDFVLIIDTREQRPLCNRVKGLTTVRSALKDGDYSIKGFETKFCIERKMNSDFYSYIGSERKKTLKKLNRFREMDWVGLVIENSFDDLMIPSMHSKVSPEVARQFLVSARIRYGLHIFLDNKRKNIERFIIDHAIKFFKIMRET